MKYRAMLRANEEVRGQPLNPARKFAHHPYQRNVDHHRRQTPTEYRRPLAFTDHVSRNDYSRNDSRNDYSRNDSRNDYSRNMVREYSRNDSREVVPRQFKETKEHPSSAHLSTLTEILFFSEHARWGQFSCYYFSPFVFQGKAYSTAEHAFQAQKFLYEGASLFHAQYAEVIRVAQTPIQAKMLGNLESPRVDEQGEVIPPLQNWQQRVYRKIAAFRNRVHRDPNWVQRRETVLLEILRAKFTQNVHCKRALLVTEARPIIFATTQDMFWGEGDRGTGLNKLGVALQTIRSELSKQVDEQGAVEMDDDNETEESTAELADE